jgi:CRP-like cAMP-binding protein
MIEIQPTLNDTIYKENEESHSVYFIINGEVELS